MFYKYSNTNHTERPNRRGGRGDKYVVFMFIRLHIFCYNALTISCRLSEEKRTNEFIDNLKKDRKCKKRKNVPTYKNISIVFVVLNLLCNCPLEPLVKTVCASCVVSKRGTCLGRSRVYDSASMLGTR